MDLPKRIDHYRIEEKIGEGGMGVVYRAWDEDLERPVAIKLVRTDRSTSASGQERFRREALTVARLTHPAIVQIYHKVRWAEGEGIVMEFVEGRTLAAILQGRPLPLDRALALLRDIAEGLAHAHAEGFVHRDLKTENVMVAATGRAKILDFGLAKDLMSVVSTLSEEGSVLGTLHCMAPEQALAQKVDHRADLFALGTMACEMLTGRSPFKGGDARDTLARVIHHHPPPLVDVDRRIPRPLSDLVRRLLAKAPEERPQSAQEVLDVLVRLTGTAGTGVRLGAPTVTEVGEPVMESPTVDDRRGKRLAPATRLRRIRRLAVLLVLVAAVTGVVAWLAGRSPGSSPRRPSLVALHLEPPTEGPIGYSAVVPELVTRYLAEIGAWRFPEGEPYIVLQQELGGKSEPLRPADIERLRALVGADHVLAGRYRAQPGPEGLELAFDLMLQDVGTGEIERLSALRGTESELERISLDVARWLVEALEPAGAPPPQGGSTGVPADPEALQLYGEGLLAERAYEYRRARDLFEAAVERDDRSPWLHAALARVQSQLGLRSEAIAASQRAVRLAADLPRRQRVEIIAWSLVYQEHWAAAARASTLLYGERSDATNTGLLLANFLSQIHSQESWSGIDEATALLGQLGEAPPSAAYGVWIDLESAQLQLARRELDEAQRLAAAVAHRASQLGLHFAGARARLVEADVFRARSLPADAFRALEEARRLYDAGGNRFGTFQAVCKMPDLLAEMGRTEEAIARTEQCRSFYLDNGDRFNFARSTANLGVLKYRVRQVEAARRLLDEARRGFEELGNRAGIANPALNAGVALFESGELRAAVESYSEALKLYEEFGPPENLATALSNVAEASYFLGDLEKALENHQSALAILEGLDEPHRLYYELWRFGEAHLARGEIDLARAALEEALLLANQLAGANRASILRTLARLELLQLNIGLARQHATAAEQAAREASQSTELALGRVVLATILLVQPSPELEDVDELLNDVRAELDVRDDFLLRHEAALLEARRLAMEGPVRVDDALDRLRPLAASPYVPYAFEARLLMGEIELLAGRAEAARRRLQALAAETRARGWKQIADRASALGG